MTAFDRSIPASWKERLGLSYRQSPELYESAEAVADVPHAQAIRAALGEMHASALFCVQGVPTVAILSVAEYDRDFVVKIHGQLWNQGLASLLLVITSDTLRAFSLARTPLQDGARFEDRCLIETLDSAAEALRFRGLIDGAESGRLWKDFSEYFPARERVDQVLLENLSKSHELLQTAGLSSRSAQSLLIQAMFIAYLEDREIVTNSYVSNISDRSAESFTDLLTRGDVKSLRKLFRTLREDFSGDLFVAPCSFETEQIPPTITPAQLAILARFREGREEMANNGQQRLWGYDFRYIPIELVSAVYDRFLGEHEAERRANGAFYTPMFLADTVVSQAWNMLSSEIRQRGRFLDPACGSGVFLVRSFQRLCENWRSTKQKKKIPWATLLSLLNQVHGWDLNGGAVRVAVFSLYVALLEEVNPRDIKKLIKKGKILPELWGYNLVCQDFFSVDSQNSQFDAIIGNPPWTSRKGPERSSIRWSSAAAAPMPGGEDAWAFTWKAMNHLAPGGLIALLLPAMGFLHNHAQNSVAARNLFFRKCRIRRVINFADLRFQLFEKAHRPTALILYGHINSAEFPYRFDYWAPKADLNLRLKRTVTLSSTDKVSLNVASVLDDPLIFKQRLWMREPDAKLFGYLSRLPKLGDLVSDFASISRRGTVASDAWIIGQGYQPFSDDPTRSRTTSLESSIVGHLPDLPIARFTRLAQSDVNLVPATSSFVRRRGFEAGFSAPAKVLVPRGVETSQSRLRATYCEGQLTFQHILQAIIIPKGEETRAKLLTALLNSRIAVWYAFHGTASFGSDRPEVQQADLLRLPFPSPSDLPDRAAAIKAQKGLVDLIDEAIVEARQPFQLGQQDPSILRRLDSMAYAFFGLSPDEIAIIDDTVEKIIPALQPHEGQIPALWQAPDATQRALYANTLCRSLAPWFHSGNAVGARLTAISADLAILQLKLGSDSEYTEDLQGDFGAVLEKLATHIHQRLDGNFQLMPNVRVFVGASLYLIKPMQLRFWLRTAALADADEIALDLQQAITTPESRSVG